MPGPQFFSDPAGFVTAPAPTNYKKTIPVFTLCSGPGSGKKKLVIRLAGQVKQCQSNDKVD